MKLFFIKKVKAVRVIIVLVLLVLLMLSYPPNIFEELFYCVYPRFGISINRINWEVASDFMLVEGLKRIYVEGDCDSEFSWGMIDCYWNNKEKWMVVIIGSENRNENTTLTTYEWLYSFDDKTIELTTVKEYDNSGNYKEIDTQEVFDSDLELMKLIDQYLRDVRFSFYTKSRLGQLCFR